MRPQSRQQGLVVQETGNEFVVYDLERHRAHCLNPTAARIWRACDGARTPPQIARDLASELAPETAGADAEAIVWMALERLDRAHLLQERVERPAAIPGRREVLRKLALVGGMTLILPAITSIVAPTPAEAQTCLPPFAACVNNTDCCSGICAAGNCT